VICRTYHAHPRVVGEPRSQEIELAAKGSAHKKASQTQVKTWAWDVGAATPKPCLECLLEEDGPLLRYRILLGPFNRITGTADGAAHFGRRRFCIFWGAEFGHRGESGRSRDRVIASLLGCHYVQRPWVCCCCQGVINVGGAVGVVRPSRGPSPLAEVLVAINDDISRRSQTPECVDAKINRDGIHQNGHALRDHDLVQELIGGVASVASYQVSV